ncbi:hypothetical protein HAQ01_00070 [Acidithiobacillus thiooxidans]|uniref:sigma factor-like helix-turn-helix DNA-binding protein n=1 Tax=Acidithiobacillus thiooxidans TaxID=930 RepID=UPI001C07018B|nr:sigma factor-like helix-turn-helix DNA-binding protein [Acidithiobacillus thiooxidans]MBU2791838.1 hypothetical protein [Acidithiobacillus thiooxidans]
MTLIPIKSQTAEPREITMERLYRQGETLAQVGDKFGLTRERVRQILKERGVSKDQGGEALQAARRKEQKERTRQQRRQARQEYLAEWCLQALGCTIDEAVRINGGKPITRQRSCRPNGSAYDKYLGIRNQVLLKNRTAYLSLPDWHQAWVRSGHWEDGPGHGWCLIKIDPQKPWELNNVHVVRAGSWIKRGKS